MFKRLSALFILFFIIFGLVPIVLCTPVEKCSNSIYFNNLYIGNHFENLYQKNIKAANNEKLAVKICAANSHKTNNGVLSPFPAKSTYFWADSMSWKRNFRQEGNLTVKDTINKYSIKRNHTIALKETKESSYLQPTKTILEKPNNIISKQKNAKIRNISVYVIPAMSDNKILPKSSISSSYISNTISVNASPGEFEPASFVIRASQDINSSSIVATNLTGSKGTIPSSSVDIRIVKCWYQGGYYMFGAVPSIYDMRVYGRVLTPELLLHDDSLIKVDGEDWTQPYTSNPNGRNYLKLINGTYIDISKDDKQYGYLDSIQIPISERPVQDANILQTFSLKSGYNKQFWVTVHVPIGTASGDYTGTISVKKGSKTTKNIILNVHIYPVKLLDPSIEESLYYRGVINSFGSISSESKTLTQFTAETQDMVNHGVKNPTIYGAFSDNNFTQMLDIRAANGMNNTNLYYLGLNVIQENIVSAYQACKSLLSPYGVVNLYIYGPDESNIRPYQTNIIDVHAEGGKIFNAQNQTLANSTADILDLAIVSGNYNKTLASTYHSNGHRIFSYANPQTYPEFPRIFRWRYGLYLWQGDFDGSMTYAYQHSFGDIWNDFDNNIKDHVFAYPTSNNVIDTIQWEGFREGTDDLRYLCTLQNMIRLAKNQGKDTLAAENYLANLKNSDLSSQNLDIIRGQMVNYTISLQNQLNYTDQLG